MSIFLKIARFSMDIVIYLQLKLKKQWFGRDLVPWGSPRETYLVRSSQGLSWANPISADFMVFMRVLLYMCSSKIQNQCPGQTTPPLTPDQFYIWHLTPD